MDRFVRGGRWFVTQLVPFWKLPALCSRVSLRRAPPVVPGTQDGFKGWEHFRPVPLSVQIHTVENVSAFP